MASYILAIDQGTTSTRCLIFDRAARLVSLAQQEHKQHYPKPGWVEHDPLEIWQNTQSVIRTALSQAALNGREIAAIGIANQRETLVVWDQSTGQPYAPAIVWQDTRTDALCQKLARDGGTDRFRTQTGLPLSTYFSGPKLRWLLDHLPELERAARNGQALCGTIESWLIWNLTGGPQGGVHVTDVTNASRTLLMNLHTLVWDEDILRALDIPQAMLPRIVPSSAPEPWGFTRKDGPLGAEVPLTAALGDQQAALIGQGCFELGELKNTYGTGCFLLLHTGMQPVPSRHGLLTTVAYQLGNQPATYALEGSVAIAGALVQWLRDNLGFFTEAAEIEALAQRVPDSGGVYMVPAFSGLFAPYWRSDARGLVIGLTRYVRKEHLCRAALEATAYQTRDVVEAMTQDAGFAPRLLKVDGGMVRNALLMQFQADVLNLPVLRSAFAEATALGAAFAAGLAIGFWPDLKALRTLCTYDQRWEPRMDAATREHLYQNWKRAVERALGWLV